MKVLITGTAGFIGFHAASKFLAAGFEVTGIDNINDYYDTDLKYDRLKESGIAKADVHYNASVRSSKWPKYKFLKLDLEDTENIDKLFHDNKFDVVIHLAAQAGVRYSLTNPRSYIQSNIVGFMNILEASRHNQVKRLVYASSSSTYGMSPKEMLSVTDNTDAPVSLYAATKKSNELMAHVYSHLYGYETIGLRFFTVYGPWGRPDMAPILFADAILNDKILRVFNHGEMQRDFTYIDDIVEGLFSISQVKLSKKYNVFNIGNNKPVQLLDFIKILEYELNKDAEKEFCELQPGDVIATWADIKEFIAATGYEPKMNIQKGVSLFVDWYKKYYE
ncbi:MAG: NAD-dependent epimerase/dehydratase family protein [Polynucleobacter sp.]|nr:NAD-dependent epimerase/dehydratase family protein [Polynucleobacter sp.]